MGEGRREKEGGFEFFIEFSELKAFMRLFEVFGYYEMKGVIKFSDSWII
jgi:hypothetical protein